LNNNVTTDSTLPSERQAGVCLHLTSLPGQFGIGEIGDAAIAFVDSMVRMNLRVWQFLPTGPTAYGDSPYQPLSTFANNEMLIDIATLTRESMVTSDEADSLRHLPAGHVDYGELVPLKKRILERVAGRFRSLATSAAKAEFDGFVEQHNSVWLHDYALYRVIKRLHKELPWLDWQTEYAQRDEKALRKIETDYGREIEDIKIIQSLFDRQWRRLHEYAADHGVILFGDLPIYIALDSADAWANRDLLCLENNGKPSHVAGVPPDYFSEHGQLWGNPVYDWHAHAATGYRWWIDRMRAAAAFSDIVRIDHFRGFEAYWSVPAAASTAQTGKWEPGPGDAIFDALRQQLEHLPIVAEDLGVITPEVEALRDRHQIPGMKVLQFEVGNDDFDLAWIHDNCVCYTGTHDNDTTAGWFAGSPDDQRSHAEILKTRKKVLEMTNGSPKTIHADLFKLACSTEARLAIAPMQDFLGLGSDARLNTPGTLGNNWRWRLTAEQLTPGIMASVADNIGTSGRSRSD